MIEVKHINQNNLHLIEALLDRLGAGASSFRYFSKRPVDVVLGHVLTIVLINERNEPVAYGHLEKEGGRTWLGIAVAEDVQGQGLGKQTMSYLLTYAKQYGENIITLTVDKDNHRAIALYEHFNFVQDQETDHYLRYVCRLA